MPRLLLAAIALTIALPLCATEPNPSADQRKSIEKLLAVMNMDDTVHATMDAMYKQMEKQLLDNAAANGNDAEDIAESKELFAAFRQRAAKIDFGGEMREAYLRIYAKYFTAEEIDAMTAFYSSPTGRKSIEVMPQLMEEGMQVGAQHLAPKIEQAYKEAVEDGEKKRPWRRTMRDIRSVYTAIEAWALDNDEKYPTGDYASLKALLVPDYLDTFPEKDIWNHEYAYVVSSDGQHFRLVSAGADTIFDWDSRRIVPMKEGEESQPIYRDRLEDDVVFADGSFVQLPVQARPKAE